MSLFDYPLMVPTVWGAISDRDADTGTSVLTRALSHCTPASKRPRVAVSEPAASPSSDHSSEPATGTSSQLLESGESMTTTTTVTSTPSTTTKTTRKTSASSRVIEYEPPKIYASEMYGGIRCFVTSDAIYPECSPTSLGMCSHIVADVQNIFARAPQRRRTVPYVLEGEMYVDGKTGPLGQKVVWDLLRSGSPSDIKQHIRFHAYDLIDLSKTRTMPYSPEVGEEGHAGPIVTGLGVVLTGMKVTKRRQCRVSYEQRADMLFELFFGETEFGQSLTYKEPYVVHAHANCTLGTLTQPSWLAKHGSATPEGHAHYLYHGDAPYDFGLISPHVFTTAPEIVEEVEIVNVEKNNSRVYGVTDSSMRPYEVIVPPHFELPLLGDMAVGERIYVKSQTTPLPCSQNVRALVNPKKWVRHAPKPHGTHVLTAYSALTLLSHHLSILAEKEMADIMGGGNTTTSAN
eukprot:PhM_4_TR9925/c0_g1_i1/m.51004